MQHEEIIEILTDPVAQRLINSPIPARFAYTAMDGTPRVVPVGFHFTGEQFVIGSPINSTKVKALQHNPKVALTIDTEDAKPDVLLVRGTVEVEIVDGVAPEYLAASKKRVPEADWEGFQQQVAVLYDRMALITITPEWVKVMDFETRAPKAVMELAAAKFG